MGFLSERQQAAAARHRKKAWTRPFIAKTYPAETIAGYYDEPSQAPTEQELKGDWTWRDEVERRGSPGGVFDRADLLMSTDIAYSGALVNPRTRVVVDGHECAVTGLTPFVEYGEIVVAGVKVK